MIFANVKIKPFTSTNEYSSGIFRWGDSITFDIQVSESSSVTIQEYEVVYTRGGNSRHHMRQVDPNFVCTTNREQMSLASRTHMQINSRTQPSFMETPWIVTVDTSVIYNCNGMTYTAQGPSLLIDNTYLIQPYYEIDPKQDCPAYGIHNLSYYKQAGNYLIFKSCGTSITVTSTQQTSWLNSYENQNKFDLGTKATLQGLGEISANLSDLENRVFTSNNTSTTTTTITQDGTTEMWMGVETRNRQSHLNVWAISDDLQNWDRSIDGDYDATYDFPWQITKRCGSSTTTPAPTNLGQCTSL